MAISGEKILKALRLFFGLFMIVVYVGMGILIGLNYFGWSSGSVATPIRYIASAIFIIYGLYRAYRQYKGVDYYSHDRVR